MGRAKAEWIEQIEKQRYFSRIAELIGITEDELDQLTYDIDPQINKDGFLYVYHITFDGDSNPKILEYIDNLEEGYYVSLHPWELDDNNYYDYEENELEWQISHSEQLKIFNKQLVAVSVLINSSIDENIKFSLLVMLHAHIVSAFEYFLASTFIYRVTNSDSLIKKLIETDPVFKKEEFKFNLSEIYIQYDDLKSKVAKYLKDLIFHNIKKIKPMFKEVLSFEFGDVTWLFIAVQLRHDCVHRAGYNTDGIAIDVTVDSINELMGKCRELAEKIDGHVSPLDIYNGMELLAHTC